MSARCDDRDRDSILRDLKSSDEEVRRLGVARVGTIGVEESIPFLIEGLGDSSWRVRTASVERIAACPDVAMAADALIPVLGDGDNPGRRNAAVEALIRCGSEALPPLADAIGTDDPDVRKLIADVLAAMADGRALPHVLSLVEDPDPNVRAATADALGAIGGEGAETALRQLAMNAEEVSLVRFSALHALSLQGKPMRASELGAALDDQTLCPVALLLLGCPDDDEAVPTLLKALAAPSRSARESAMRSLLILIGRSDGARTEELVAQIREVADSSPTLVGSAVHRLADADLPTRLTLIQFLGLSRIPEAVVPILRAGRDEALAEVSLSTLEALGPMAEDTLDGFWSDLDPASRRDACALLGRTHGDRGALRLLEALDDAEPEVRIAAARAVGQRAAAAAVPVLVRRLGAAARDGEFDIGDEIVAVTEALITLSERASLTDEVVELLGSHLDGAPDQVRFAMAGLLATIARPADAPMVELLLRDPDAGVRRAAVHALARIDPVAATETLRPALGDESARVRAAAARALGSCPSDAVFGDLRRLAGDKEPRVRAAAVRAAGDRYSGSDEAHRKVVLDLIAAGLVDDTMVALAAVKALSEVGGPGAARAADVLQRGEPEVVLEAIGCLAAHATPDGLGVVIRLVSHPDWSVRAEAIRTLANRGVARAVPAILRRLETEQDELVRDEMLRALKRLEG